MTEQEKQAIRDDLKIYTPCTSRETHLEDYCNELLDALDERDREVERLRNALNDIMGVYDNEPDDQVCMRKMNRIARQALSGEEK